MTTNVTITQRHGVRMLKCKVDGIPCTTFNNERMLAIMAGEKITVTEVEYQLSDMYTLQRDVYQRPEDEDIEAELANEMDIILNASGCF